MFFVFLLWERVNYLYNHLITLQQCQSSSTQIQISSNCVDSRKLIYFPDYNGIRIWTQNSPRSVTNCCIDQRSKPCADRIDPSPVSLQWYVLYFRRRLPGQVIPARHLRKHLLFFSFTTPLHRYETCQFFKIPFKMKILNAQPILFSKAICYDCSILAQVLKKIKNKHSSGVKITQRRRKGRRHGNEAIK